jgi:hypothetical protein
MRRQPIATQKIECLVERKAGISAAFYRSISPFARPVISGLISTGGADGI